MADKKPERRLIMRIRDDNLWDDIGIQSHSNGQTRNQWTFSLIKRELIRSEVDVILDRKTSECVLTMYKYLESQSPDEFSRHKQKVAHYLRQLEDHADR